MHHIIKEGNLTKAEQVLNESPVIKCPYCDCEFKSDEAEISIMGTRVNSTQHNFTCPYCNNKFTIISSFDRVDDGEWETRGTILTNSHLSNIERWINR